MDLLIDILGWIGSLLVVVAYGLNSYQKIKSDSLFFYALNLLGGVFLIVYSVHKAAYANTFVNIVWVVIAIPALIHVIRKKSKF